ncbi:MAG: hypothetical protein DRI86_08740 [Bacteroidetes bacterium]|nr:MAG: hypothetical protein DRI86_08740 [Bacteroidota bacterium]
MTEARKCLECNTEIFGRIDKKFCSDQCRNTYNNRTQAHQNKYIRKVNYTLRKNRRIMEAFVLTTDKNVKRVKKSDMLDKGFNFDFYTNIYSTKNKKYYYFSYEYGYNILEDNYIAIVRRDEYLK